MGHSAISRFLTQPREPSAPKHVWWDWVFVASLVMTATSELILRIDLGPRPIVALLTIPPLLALRWRRTSPLVVVVLAFVAHGVSDAAVRYNTPNQYMLYATAAYLLLPYALFRWGSGRDCAFGLMVMALTHVPSRLTGIRTLLEFGLAVAFILVPAQLGYAVRIRAASRVQEHDRVRMHEREQLARELHDSVAHHVSAIVIQAQAGQAVATSDPASVTVVLKAIEAEAARTLGEMRALVGALRQSEAAVEFNPQRGVNDIAELVRGTGATGRAGIGRVRVSVSQSGELDDLAPIVDTAIFRLAQEAITNALRHARNATHIAVSVAGELHDIHITVEDDGEPASSALINSGGFGLIGMRERTALLNGTFSAGPGSRRGWTIRATLPRDGKAHAAPDKAEIATPLTVGRHLSQTA